MASNVAIRAGGASLAAASALMIAAIVSHGPIAPEITAQMARIAGRPTAWAVAHWIAAAGLSLHVVAGLIMLTAGSRLTAGGWTLSAWAVLPVAALWTMTTAVAEATVVTNAAIAGNAEVFEAWWMFAEGKANGFSFLALAVVVIAGHDARSSARATPAWSARVAMVAAIGSFTGWALSMWFGFGPASLLWLASSVLMSVWTAWFGVALARSGGAADVSGIERAAVRTA